MTTSLNAGRGSVIVAKKLHIAAPAEPRVRDVAAWVMKEPRVVGTESMAPDTNVRRPTNSGCTPARRTRFRMFRLRMFRLRMFGPSQIVPAVYNLRAEALTMARVVKGKQKSKRSA